MKRSAVIFLLVACGGDSIADATDDSGGTSTLSPTSAPPVTSSDSTLATDSIDASGDGSIGSEEGPSSSTTAFGPDVQPGVCDAYGSVMEELWVYSQQDADAAAGVECIAGALVVYGGQEEPVEDLAPFSQLTVVGEHVHINQMQTEQLQGLESLEWIGGDLVLGSVTPGVEGCASNPGLLSLDALAGVEHFENLMICGGLNDALLSIDGLDSALEGELDGHVELSYLAQLDSIAALDGVTGVGLTLVELPMLNDLSPLGDLSSSSSITLAGTGVNDLHGLESLTSVDDRLGIVGNPQLVTLAGLRTLVQVGSLYITDNQSLPQSEAEDLAASILVARETVICGNLGGDPCS